MGYFSVYEAVWCWGALFPRQNNIDIRALDGWPVYVLLLPECQKTKTKTTICNVVEVTDLWWFLTSFVSQAAALSFLLYLTTAARDSHAFLLSICCSQLTPHRIALSSTHT